jgi:hypothetical protein
MRTDDTVCRPMRVDRLPHEIAHHAGVQRVWFDADCRGSPIKGYLDHSAGGHFFPGRSTLTASAMLIVIRSSPNSSGPA